MSIILQINKVKFPETKHDLWAYYWNWPRVSWKCGFLYIFHAFLQFSHDRGSGYGPFIKKKQLNYISLSYKFGCYMFIVFFFLKKTDILKIITNRRAIIYLIKVFNILAAYPKRKGKYILVTSCIKMRANQRIVSLC